MTCIIACEIIKSGKVKGTSHRRMKQYDYDDGAAKRAAGDTLL